MSNIGTSAEYNSQVKVESLDSGLCLVLEEWPIVLTRYLTYFLKGNGTYPQSVFEFLYMDLLIGMKKFQTGLHSYFSPELGNILKPITKTRFLENFICIFNSLILFMILLFLKK
uniref:Uncharacterized protein n=1 Tax=Micrurus paraensis TaxID=1970185 RepID=A0A2D4KUK9_9SAUR